MKFGNTFTKSAKSSEYSEVVDLDIKISPNDAFQSFCCATRLMLHVDPDTSGVLLKITNVKVWTKSFSIGALSNSIRLSQLGRKFEKKVKCSKKY